MLLLITTVSLQAGPYYVVVGNFTHEGAAGILASSIRSIFSGASLYHDRDRHLYYVHVKETQWRQEAEIFRRDLQRGHGFHNAWIFRDSGEIGNAAEGADGSQDYARLELYTGGSVLLGSGGDTYLAVSKNNEVIPKRDDVSLRRVVCIAETSTGRSLAGSVRIIDHQGEVISTLKTGEEVGFSWRADSRVLRLQCRVPGYNMETRVIDLSNLGAAEQILKSEQGVWEIHFLVTAEDVDEVKLRYHELFYRDAAIMRPEAMDKLEALVSLMRSDKRSRIEIDVHCNPGMRRPFTLRSKRDTYFDLDSGREKVGSDRHLTAMRAETLRDYLVDQGIDPVRITVMGWGSMVPMVKDNPAKAHLNERTDIELKIDG